VSQEGHDEWIINLWNSQVGKNDEVWSLGDFAFTSNYEKLADILGRLNGRKCFLLGNHCQSKVWDKIKKARAEDSRLGSIALIYKLKATHFEINGKKEMFVMCHFAMRTWWNQHYGSYHCFGHAHGSLITDDRSMDVGLDAAYNNFGEHRLFTLEEVYDILSKREIKSGDYHKVA
jgi:calcineurin-like phosphoesterase family protein